jgi:hypothetical protein
MIKVIIPYQIIGVICYQLLNFAFLKSFGLDFNYLVAGYVFISLHLLVILMLYIVNKKWPRYLKPAMKSNDQEQELRKTELHNIL